MNFLFNLRLVGLIYLLIFNYCPGLAQLDTIPSSNEKAFLLNSKILGEKRSIWVHVPPNYYSTVHSYPVLYLLDGESHFKYVSQLVDYFCDHDQNRTPPIIVVGIVNIDRGKDLNLVHSTVNGKIDSNNIVTTAGAGKFLRFIKDELVPYINKKYRTDPYNILAGHSLAGQFSLFAKIQFPTLFQSTLLISPSIHDADEKLIDQFASDLKTNQELSGKMFISLGNENSGKVDSLTQQLKTFSNSHFQWHYEHYKDENHFSVTYKSFFDGLKFIYWNWFVDFFDSAKLAHQDIEEHFRKLSREFGYNITPDEDFINSLGYMQLSSGHMNEAIVFFQQNIKDNPHSYNVYDSMGEAYMVNGDKKLAIIYYEKSLKLNHNNANAVTMLKKLKSSKK